jgi:hypothetical protein
MYTNAVCPLSHQIQAEADDEQPLSYSHRLKKCFRMRRITRQALMDPFSSAFIKLYNSQCTQSLIMYTGFDYVSFHSLLLLFTPYFNKCSPYSHDGKIVRIMREKGRKWMISPIALVLGWFCC